VARNESKIRLHSEKYQTAWEAIRRLNGGDESMVGWNVLRKDDIRCMEDSEDLRKKAKECEAQRARWQKKNAQLRAHGLLPSEVDDDMAVDDDGEDAGPAERGAENRCQVSWIWTIAGTEGMDAALENGTWKIGWGGWCTDLCFSALRVEWSKVFARVRQWTEEKRLLVEEYRRVGLSFDHEAAEWEARAAAVHVGVLPLADAEGAVTYAAKHVEMFRDLKIRSDKTWTEEKTPSGRKKQRHVSSAMGAMEAETLAEQEDQEWWMRVAEAEREERAEDEDVLLRGDVESDEEYILGSEGFDD
jgi:hypothetical protein